MLTNQETVIAKAKIIELAIFDVDGVMTDGRLIFDEKGKEYKAFNAKDGLGIKLLLQNGIEVAVISGRDSKTVTKRMQSLGIEFIFQGQRDKGAALEKLLIKVKVNPENVAFVGDDLPDLVVMSKVGLAIAVQDAHFAVKQHADWCTQLKGGCGAVREVCDLLLETQNNLEKTIDHYL